MKNKKLAILMSFIITVSTLVTVWATEAGTSNDPLVAKSYVDDLIEQVLARIDAIDVNNSVSGTEEDTAYQQYKDDIVADVKEALKEEIMAEVDSLRQRVETLHDASERENQTMTGSTNSFVTVFAEVGQVVLGEDGSEFILRSGKADGYITGVDGIVNATTGLEINHGDKVPSNNLLLVPRGDGRGFKMTEAGWFMIKGKYTIQ